MPLDRPWSTRQTAGRQAPGAAQKFSFKGWLISSGSYAAVVIMVLMLDKIIIGKFSQLWSYVLQYIYYISLLGSVAIIVVMALLNPYRSYIVGGLFPYIRRGYIFVALICIIPTFMIVLQPDLILTILVIILFQIVGLLSTVLSALIGRYFGLCDDFPPVRPVVDDQEPR